MSDRELMQMALDALESLQAWPETPENFKRFCAIEALRARLSQNKFNPDWDAMAVMVEEQQRMARRIEELTQREWVGLTNAEYEAMAEQYVTNCYFDTLKYARAIEAKLKEKNA